MSVISMTDSSDDFTDVGNDADFAQLADECLLDPEHVKKIYQLAHANVMTVFQKHMSRQNVENQLNAAFTGRPEGKNVVKAASSVQLWARNVLATRGHQKFANASSKEGGSASAAPQLQLLGVEGEYMGEVLDMTLPWGAGAAAKTILLGRSSSCDVTLSRDDQISRRHMQIEGRDGKLIARDLGSTYGTKVNGKALNGEPAEVKPGDVIMLGASSFQLQAVGGK